MKKLNNNGMTLVELIVSFAIVTVAVVYFSQSLVSISRIYKNTRKETDEYVTENYAIRLLESMDKFLRSNSNGYYAISIIDSSTYSKINIPNISKIDNGNNLIDTTNEFDEYEKALKNLTVYVYSDIEYRKSGSKYKLNEDHLYTFTFSTCFDGWKTEFKNSIGSILNAKDELQLSVPRFFHGVKFQSGPNDPLGLGYDYIYPKNTPPIGVCNNENKFNSSIGNGQGTGYDNGYNTYDKEYKYIIASPYVYRTSDGTTQMWEEALRHDKNPIVAQKLLYYLENVLINKGEAHFHKQGPSVHRWNNYSRSLTNCSYSCIHDRKQYLYTHLVNSNSYTSGSGILDYKNNCINNVNKITKKDGTIIEDGVNLDIYSLDYWIQLGMNPSRLGFDQSSIFYNPYKKLILHVGFIGDNEYRYYAHFDHNDYDVRYYSIYYLGYSPSARPSTLFRILTGRTKGLT